MFCVYSQFISRSSLGRFLPYANLLKQTTKLHIIIQVLSFKSGIMILYYYSERLFTDKISVTEEEKQELMETVDFSRLSESTLQRAYDSQLVPGSYITKAALALCAKLRSELDSSRAVIRVQDEQLARFGMGTGSHNPAASTWRPSHETSKFITSLSPSNRTRGVVVEGCRCRLRSFSSRQFRC